MAVMTSDYVGKVGEVLRMPLRLFFKMDCSNDEYDRWLHKLHDEWGDIIVWWGGKELAYSDKLEGETLSEGAKLIVKAPVSPSADILGLGVGLYLSNRFKIARTGRTGPPRQEWKKVRPALTPTWNRPPKLEPTGAADGIQDSVHRHGIQRLAQKAATPTGGEDGGF